MQEIALVGNITNGIRDMQNVKRFIKIFYRLFIHPLFFRMRLFQEKLCHPVGISGMHVPIFLFCPLSDVSPGRKPCVQIPYTRQGCDDFIMISRHFSIGQYPVDLEIQLLNGRYLFICHFPTSKLPYFRMGMQTKSWTGNRQFFPISLSKLELFL